MIFVTRKENTKTSENDIRNLPKCCIPYYLLVSVKLNSCVQKGWEREGAEKKKNGVLEVVSVCTPYRQTGRLCNGGEIRDE